MSKVISVNSGSSSLKFQLFDMPSETVLASGQAERIGQDMGAFTIKFDGQKKGLCVESKTNEEEVEVQTETLSVKATPMANGCVKAKTGDDTTDSVYQNWYSAVYLPVELPAEEPANG